MIEKILLLKNAIKNLAMSDLWIESNINNLQNVLRPINLAVKALCRREVSIIRAVIMNTLSQQISSINTSLGKIMFESLICRNGEIRAIKLVTLTEYLKDSEFF